ncbi:MAG: response regulator [Balneolales bacterium]
MVYHPAVQENNSIPVTILLVEDDHVNMNLFCIMLKEINADWNILGAVNGKDAIAKFTKQRPDLIFMDIQMPVMDGIKATKAIRELERENQVPIIAVTASVFVHDRNHCFEAGMNDFTTKPIVMDTFKIMIDKWLPAELTGSYL